MIDLQTIWELPINNAPSEIWNRLLNQCPLPEGISAINETASGILNVPVSEYTVKLGITVIDNIGGWDHSTGVQFILNKVVNDIEMCTGIGGSDMNAVIDEKKVIEESLEIIQSKLRTAKDWLKAWLKLSEIERDTR